MNKVFLSHSSNQKGFVSVIANKLGKNNIIYDEYTFEAAEITLDEIYKGIDQTGIFVFFISKQSLESDWVKKEILKAEEYLKNGKLKKFLPIIIDPEITYKNENIPNWIRDNYNLKYFSKPSKVYDLIKQALIIVNWELYPKRKELDQLFIGRTNQIKEFEQRIFDYTLDTPSNLFICGLSSIGRRKFLKHTLTNSNIIKSNYDFPSIILDNRNSIEDFIYKVYGLGYSEKQSEEIENLTTKTIDEKVVLAFDLILELQKNKDILLIIDNYSIVNSTGLISDWYSLLIEKMKEINNVCVCIISSAKIRSQIVRNNNNSIFALNIPELEPYERASYFQAILKIEELEMKKENYRIINDIFTGFPEQISYASSILKSEGEPYLMDNLNEVVDFNFEKVSKVLTKYNENPLALQILKLLSDSECISIIFLKDILADDFDESKEILSALSNSFIIEYVGASKEFIRLNDSIKDYVQRINYSLEEKFKTNIKEHITKSFDENSLLERDTSEFYITIKEALKNNLEIPQKYLIPSHYINAMRELYNNENKYNEVIELADRILLNENYLDKKIVKEIRYWLCLALCRKRNERLLIEVQKIDGIDHNFLLGFYYRLKGRNLEAIDKFNDVLAQNPKFYRAKRELVQVYINIERFKDALQLAKDSYIQDKSNPFNLQSYFRCLIKTEINTSKEELKRLVNELQKNPHQKAQEMFLTAKAQYECFVENNKVTALNFVNDAIATYPKNIYPYLTKLDILKKYEDINELEKCLTDIEQKFDRENEIFKRLMYLKAVVFLKVKNQDYTGAKDFFYRNIENKFGQTVNELILQEIEQK